jgi:hypothetical protein
MGVNDLDLAHTLADAFNALADEVQTLADRRTVLEHKLRFAHEQVRFTAYILRYLPVIAFPPAPTPRLFMMKIFSSRSRAAFVC